jgi:hypothetical protein
MRLKTNKYGYNMENAWGALNIFSSEGQYGAPIRTPYLDENNDVKFYTLGVLTKYDCIIN